MDGAREFEVDGISDRGGNGSGLEGERTVVTNVDANVGSGDKASESEKGDSELHGDGCEGRRKRWLRGGTLVSMGALYIGSVLRAPVNQNAAY